jgi:hypothetical protein
MRTTLITTAGESSTVVSRASEIAPRRPTDLEAPQALAAAAGS